MLGAGPLRLMLRHILPNVVSSLVIKAGLNVGTVLLILSGLGFLGIGAQRPTPEWGTQVSTAAQHMFRISRICPGAWRGALPSGTPA